MWPPLTFSKHQNFPSQVTKLGTSNKQSPLIIESNHNFDNLVPMVLSDLSLWSSREITVETSLTFWMTVYFFPSFLFSQKLPLWGMVWWALCSVYALNYPVCKQLLVAALLSIWNGIQWILLWNVVLTSHKQPLSVNFHILGGCLQEVQLHYHSGEWRSKTSCR